MMFAGAAVIGAAAEGHVAGSAQVLAFAMVPAFTVFFVGREDDDAMRLLTPAVVGAAGLGLVVPTVWPASSLGYGWLAAVLAVAGLVGLAGIRLHGLIREIPLVWAGAAGSGCAALVAGCAWRVFAAGPVDVSFGAIARESVWGLLLDGALVLLTVWLLREMEPVGFSSRWVLIPAVTLLGSIVAVRPEVGWVGWLGLGLAVGTGWVLVRATASR